VITRALGTEPDVDVDAFTVDARDGDVFLLCSDGLTTMVDARTISEIVQRNRAQLHDATHALIKAANDRGGDDNITAVLFAVADGDPDATQSLPVHGAAHDPDDEDTLHPEDGVPAITDVPSAVDTMVVSAADVRSALTEQEPEVPQAGTREAGIARRLLALMVIAALIALIVVLVWWGLAR